MFGRIVIVLALLCMGQTPYGRGAHSGNGVYGGVDGNRGGRNSVTSPPEITHFWTPLDSSGVDSLPGGSCGALEINGQSLSPFFCLDARDATATTWPARVGSATFSLTGTGDDPVQLDTAFLDGTQETRCQDGARLLTNSTDLGAFGFGLFDAFIVAVVRENSAGGYSRIVSPTDTSSVFQLVASPSGIEASSRNAATTTITSKTATLDASGTYLYIVGYDRDHAASIQGYLGGVISGTVANATAHSGESLTADGGAVNIFGPSGTDAGLLYYAAYRGSELFANGANDAPTQALAAELFARFNGTYANRADTQAPTFTRASVATIQNTATGAVTTVPSGWPVVEADGYRPESAATNEITNSRMDTGWSTLNATGATSATTRAPDGVFSQEFFDDATNGGHGPYQNFTFAAVPYVFSVRAEKTSKRWLFMKCSGQTAWLDLDTGNVGTEGGGVNGYMTPDGGGRYVLEISFTPSAGASNCWISSADADGSSSYIGDGSSIAFLSGAQLELDNGTGRASSHIPTAASPVTRAQALLNYTHAGAAGDGFILSTEYTITSTTAFQNSMIAFVNDGTNNNMVYHRALTTGKYQSNVYSGGVAYGPLASDAVTAFDGSSHRVMTLARTNRLLQYVDGAMDPGTIDTSITIPATTTVNIGYQPAGPTTTWLPGHVKDIRILGY